ncbi:hypothetical protein VCHA38O209_50256 [Vibrio chagasii]|nr:hypothetical protein VCHA38O209_50256 [Vibrio chagasii]
MKTQTTHYNPSAVNRETTKPVSLYMEKSNKVMFGFVLIVIGLLAGLYGIKSFNSDWLAICGFFEVVGMLTIVVGSIQNTIIKSHNINLEINNIK